MPITIKISSPFGATEPFRNGAPHTGIDIPLDTGTKVRTIANGVVDKVVDYGDKSIGKGVIIRTEDGNYHIYGHLSEVYVNTGQHVKAAREIIGLSGNTGHSTGPHLHFGIQLADGKFIDPAYALAHLRSSIGDLGFWSNVREKILYTGMPSLDQKKAVHDAIQEGAGNIIGFPTPGAATVHHYADSPFWNSILTWCVNSLPDMMGYGALVAAVCIILGSMIGSGGMIKPLALYAGILIIAVLILAGV
jgi:hypothetical protein